MFTYLYTYTHIAISKMLYPKNLLMGFSCQKKKKKMKKITKIIMTLIIIKWKDNILSIFVIIIYYRYLFMLTLARCVSIPLSRCCLLVFLGLSVWMLFNDFDFSLVHSPNWYLISCSSHKSNLYEKKVFYFVFAHEQNDPLYYMATMYLQKRPGVWGWLKHIEFKF